ncbi:tumor necrosis factor receptor superfamily member 6 isoform X5 [Alosa alosa]|uniref:tumor necrosis factor receptor superfamily member 6 isoform X5 n=1 Tax=Alosa alosa TaxID=278164 RepID=UPI002015312E|nr:tumor necrosis factor receptor superfamily member 6 isoform X5 [Alosa alosa]
MRVVSYNSRGLRVGHTAADKARRLVVDALLGDSDVLCIQESWLAKQDLDKLNDLHPDFHGAGESTTDLSTKIVKANLEEERHCTTTSDVICTCKKGYFCEGEHCKACHQCEECELGEEEPCTPRNNTVCKKHSGAKDTAGIAIGAAVAVVVVVALICGALWWKKKFCFAQRLAAADHPEQKIPLKGIDLKQFIGDIVDLLSWSDMVKVADRTGMDNVQVVRHKHDNPTAEEQTRSLLIAWIELQGLDQASETLCQTLRKCNLNQKADKIERLISPKVDV